MGILLGMAKTELPSVRRQRLLRACLAKLAGAESTVMLEAWQLAKGSNRFFDLELFLQCERIVEATHGTGIHDLFDHDDIDAPGDRRQVSWTNYQNWDHDDELHVIRDQSKDLCDYEVANWGDYERMKTPRASPEHLPLSPPGEYV